MKILRIFLIIALLLLAASNVIAGQKWHLLNGTLNTPREALTGEYLNGYIYAIGGCILPCSPSDAQNVVSIYNPVTDSWTIDSNSMPTARHSLSSAVIDGWIYAVGGHVSNSRSENEKYNGTSWETKASVYARSGPGVAAFNGELYVFGGNHYSTILSRVDIYDPNTDTWRSGCDMPAATEPWRATTLGNKIYVLASAYVDPKKVWCYDPVGCTWDTSIPLMNVSRTCCELQAVHGRIYAIGGRNESDGNLSSVESWAPGEVCWRFEPSLNIARSEFASAVIGQDIYIFGGYDGNVLGSTEVLKTLDLKCPNGGENWMAGTTKTISWETWDANIIPNVHIEYSSNNGAVWNDVNTVLNTGSYQWLVPDVTSNQCLVRIRDASDANIFDVSDDVFTIFVCQLDSKADMDGDCKVDMTDLALFCNDWLRNGNPFACTYKVENLIQITDGPIAESSGVFNANGTKIAYRNFHEPYSWDNCDIWDMNTDGSGKTPIISESAGEFNPRFAPDGRITYVKEFGSNDYNIWMVNADGSNPCELIGGPLRQGGHHLYWHSDGRKLVYTNEYILSASELWDADVEGCGNVTNNRQLTDHTVDGYCQFLPICSHSCNLIAYGNYAINSGPSHVWVMNSDGTGNHQITSGSGETPMFWDPYDSRIGYIQNGDVWTRNLTSGKDDLLLHIPGRAIDWCDLSADGSKLVFDTGGHIWIGDVFCD